MPTCHIAPSDSGGGLQLQEDRALAARGKLEHITDHVLKISLMGGGLVAQLPERSQRRALRHLEELDEVVVELRAVIVDLSAVE